MRCGWWHVERGWLAGTGCLETGWLGLPFGGFVDKGWERIVEFGSDFKEFDSQGKLSRRSVNSWLTLRGYLDEMEMDEDGWRWYSG
jgi:hypothetical protein